MRSVERRGEIAAPAEAVFQFLADFENPPRWQPGVISARPLTDGPLRIGSAARVATRVVGQPVEADVRVVDIEPPRLVTFETVVSGVRAVAVVGVGSVGPGRSEVLLRLGIEASGFTRFMEPMIASGAERELDGALDRLRQAIEAPAA